MLALMISVCYCAGHATVQAFHVICTHRQRIVTTCGVRSSNAASHHGAPARKLRRHIGTVCGCWRGGVLGVELSENCQLCSRESKAVFAASLKHINVAGILHMCRCCLMNRPFVGRWIAMSKCRTRFLAFAAAFR